MLLLKLFSLLSTETVFYMLIIQNSVLQIWIIQKFINMSDFSAQLSLFLLASCPLQVHYPSSSLHAVKGRGGENTICRLSYLSEALMKEVCPWLPIVDFFSICFQLKLKLLVFI